MPYKTVVIGTGRIGTEHAQYINHHKNLTLVSCANRSSDSMEQFRKTLNLSSSYNDYKEMFAIEKPDIVSIATYVGSHCQIIVDAVKAGVKGIVCEKPFLGAPAEIKIIRDLIERTGAKIVVPHMRRYLPVFYKAKEFYNSGIVGEPIMCMAGYDGRDLVEYGSHWLDMIRFFNNDAQAEWVMAQCHVRENKAFEHVMEEHGILTCQFSNGGRAYLDGGKALNSSFAMVLVGSEGIIGIEGENALTICSKEKNEKIDYLGTVPERWKKEQFNYIYDNEWVAVWDILFDDLAMWMDGGEEPMTGATNMLHTAELSLAAYLSFVKQDRIDLPLKDLSCNQWPLEELSEK